MRSTLRSRLAKLEARRRVAVLRYGLLRPLPKNFIGERHVAIAIRDPTATVGMERCEFEERPGPAPPDSEDLGSTLYLTEDDLKL